MRKKVFVLFIAYHWLIINGELSSNTNAPTEIETGCLLLLLTAHTTVTFF